MLRDVLAVKVKRRRAVGQRSGGPVLGVALFHCKRRGRRLEEDTLHLHNASSEHTHTWYNSLKEVLAGKAQYCLWMYVVFFFFWVIRALHGGSEITSPHFSSSGSLKMVNNSSVI